MGSELKFNSINQDLVERGREKWEGGDRYAVLCCFTPEQIWIAKTKAGTEVWENYANDINMLEKLVFLTNLYTYAYVVANILP